VVLSPRAEKILLAMAVAAGPDYISRAGGPSASAAFVPPEPGALPALLVEKRYCALKPVIVHAHLADPNVCPSAFRVP
jgi:hypothetical protein